MFQNSLSVVIESLLTTAAVGVDVAERTDAERGQRGRPRAESEKVDDLHKIWLIKVTPKLCAGISPDNRSIEIKIHLKETFIQLSLPLRVQCETDASFPLLHIFSRILRRPIHPFIRA